MSRARCLCLLLSGLFAGTAAAVADDGQSTIGDTLFLTVREPDPYKERARIAPFLARELVRQAFLIAARDECGLRTRDATLREEIPQSADARSAVFEMFCASNGTPKGPEIEYSLSRQDGGEQKKVWEWKSEALQRPEIIPALAERAEALSRGELKDLLKKMGATKTVPPARQSTEVARATQDQLFGWNEIAVVGGLRRVHGEIAERGESPELLAALAVGYANLGSLTDYYFSPAHKAFAARALLYAERLLRKTDNSAWALWHRAYVRALAGLHQLAAEDVAAAKKRLADSPGSQALPFWTEVIDLFCQGKLTRMQAAAKSPAQQHLANYLRLEAVMRSASTEITIDTALKVLVEGTFCFRASDVMSKTRSTGPMRFVRDQFAGNMARTLYYRLAEVPGLPEGLPAQIKSVPLPKDVEAALPWWVKVVGDLREAGAPSRDTMEPSLSALAQMIDEIQFANIIQQLELEGRVLAVPTEKTIATYRPLYEHHRYAAYVDSFARQKDIRDQAAQTLLQRCEPTEFEYAEVPLFQFVRGYDAKRGVSWYQAAYSHADAVFRDLMLGAQLGPANRPNDQKVNGPYMELLGKTSATLPATVAMQIERNWNAMEPQSAKIEEDYADDPLVMSALARRYVFLKRYDDAERCASQRVRIAPDYASYNSLADIYQKKGNSNRWKETLEESLEIKGYGLESATNRNKLAQYHMQRKEWKEAVAFADEAAKSYAAWAMQTAARCHEMLGEWDKSEDFMRKTSERYQGASIQWMLWCHRTGHGNTEAADQCAQNYFDKMAKFPTPVLLEQSGVYHLLRKENEPALANFKQAYDRGHAVYYAMQVALIADSMGTAAERDDYLSRIVEAGKGKDAKSFIGVYARIAELMQRAVASGGAKDFNVEEADRLIHDAAKVTSPPVLQYFVGVFLKNRGDAERASTFLVRSAQSAEYQRFNCVLACQLVRELRLSTPAP